MQTQLRTHTCGALRKEDVGRRVTLAGWVHTVRDHGGVLFVDLRDRFGITQIVFNPRRNGELHERANMLRSEYVIRVEGVVEERSAETINPRMATGEIEVPADTLEVISKSETPPFEIDPEINVAEERRMEYRYIDTRRGPMLDNLIFRDKVFTVIRNYFHTLSFTEVETPMLTKSTPEGARDYIVPSRVNPGHFFALPQSPQIFKQLLMVGGLDRYFQIVRCFRDEDLRADRQPEFTQLDVEMAFVEREDIVRIIETMMAEVFREAMGIEIELPILRLTYKEAIDRFGTDKPDMRFGTELTDISDLAAESGFNIFKKVVGGGGQVKGICVAGGGEYSRTEIEKWVPLVQATGAGGMAWFKVADGKLASQIAKFFDEPLQRKIVERFSASDGDLLLFVADKPKQVAASLDWLRRSMAERRDLIHKGEFKLLWVLDFPLFEYNDVERRYEPSHHPFTGVMPEDMHKLDDDLGDIRSTAYDIVLNGTELGSGSIRIHDTEFQSRIFSLLGIGEEEAEEKFGFLLRALKYGAPPHGGIALGLDRIVQILLGAESIRDVIAFPKTQRAACPLTQAPGVVSERQLRELGIQIRE